MNSPFMNRSLSALLNQLQHLADVEKVHSAGPPVRGPWEYSRSAPGRTAESPEPFFFARFRTFLRMHLCAHVAASREVDPAEQVDPTGPASPFLPPAIGTNLDEFLPPDKTIGDARFSARHGNQKKLKPASTRVTAS